MIPLDDPVTRPVRRLLSQIRVQAQGQETAWEIVAGGLLLQALGLLARSLLEKNHSLLESEAQRKSLRRIRPALSYIEAHYTKSISLDDICEIAHLSRSQCCSLFQVALGTTPVTYRNVRRLSEARNLLQKLPPIPIHEIASRVWIWKCSGIQSPFPS